MTQFTGAGTSQPEWYAESIVSKHDSMLTLDQIAQQIAHARKLAKSQSGEALALAEDARQQAAMQGAHALEASALCLHAHALLMLGRHEETLQTLQLATALAEHHSIGPHEGETLQLLARAYFIRSQYTEAGEYWRRCLMLDSESISNETRTRAHIGLGLVHLTRERLDMALEHHRMAESLALESDDPLLHSDAQLHVAADLIKLGQPDAAMAMLKETLPQVRAGKSYEMEAEIYGLIGEIHLLHGEIDKAEAMLMVALKINRLSVNLAGEAANLISLGTCELHGKETESALEFLNYAHALAVESGSKRLLSRAEGVLAQIYQAMDDPVSAEQHAREYQRLNEEILHPTQTE